MSVLAACVFSLFWGAVVWVLPAATGGGRPASLWSPGMLLAAITALVFPSMIFAAGWQWPLQEMFVAAHTAKTGVELLAMADVASRSVVPPAWKAPGLQSVLVGLYVAGVALAVARQAFATLRIFLIVRGARHVAVTRDRRKLLLTERSVAPFAVGGPPAAIVLPEAMLGALPREQIDLIVAHEEAHLRHRDPFVSQCLALLCAIFWFNPFLKDLVGRWRCASELRADGDALNGADADVRKAYAQALVDALRAWSNPIPVSFTSRNARSDKLRIRAIIKGFEFAARGRTRLLAGCTVLMLTAAGTAGALTANTAASTTLEDFIPGGWVTSAYGVKRKNLRVHTGIDVAARRGTEIVTPTDALVTQATDLFRGNPRWGKAVVLEFDGDVVVWLTHLDSYTVSPGDKVTAGQVIGTVGSTGQSTGPHVHVEMYKNNRRVDPVTIWPFLKKDAR